MSQCPICSTEYIEEETTYCLTCGWDLTPYPLTFQLPEVFIQKEQAKLAWAKEIWQQKQQIYAELLELQTTRHKPLNIPSQPPNQVEYPTTWLSGDLKIHQFLTGFLDVKFSSVHRRWVTGGFGEKIGHYDHPVPEKIKLAVNKGYFHINDSYPPLEDEVALIAIDIDEYSILAVATREIDDKNRLLVAYRYFWLEKSHPDVDGIGSLVLWWFTNSQPRFIMNKNSPLAQLPLGRLYTSKYFEQYNSEITEILQQSSALPCLLTINKTNHQTLPTVTGCHCLALHLYNNQQPISWAWNVSFLENTHIFTVICCADNKGFQTISRALYS